MLSQLALRRELLHLRTVVLLALCCCPAYGCSGGKAALVPVKGSVRVKGEAPEGAVVMFHPQGSPDGQTASGVVRDDGTFTLSSGLELGLVPGTYKVTVTWPDPSVQPTPEQKMMGTAEPGPDLLNGKYAEAATTSLTAEIKSGTSELPPFELEAP